MKIITFFFVCQFEAMILYETRFKNGVVLCNSIENIYAKCHVDDDQMAGAQMSMRKGFDLGPYQTQMA